MVCPKCGNELADGHLYCEVCGEEIQMVPDFDFQIEESINVTLSSVADEVTGQPQKPSDAEQQVHEPKSGKKVSGKKKQNIFKLNPVWIASIAVVFVVIIIVIVLLSVNASSSQERAFDRAVSMYQSGDYQGVITALKDENSEEIQDYDSILMLSDSYLKLQKYDECIAVATTGLQTFSGDTELTDRLLTSYIALNEMDSVKKVLQATKNTEILARYADYFAKPPVFSLEPGTYTDDEQLVLSAEEDCKIFFTLDGSMPTEASDVYHNPFIFDVGEHTITAIAQNSLGLMSDPVRNTYVIERKQLNDPVLLTESGTYSDPELIRLEKPVGAVIYYTDDGTDPTTESIVYNQPIAMPLREKTYKFIMVDKEGVSSRIIEATYNLRMVTLVDVPVAEQAIQFCLNVGGNSVKQSEYKSTSAYRYNNNNYYLVDEFSTQSVDKVKTGRVYAVDVLTGEMFKVDMSSVNGDYSLQPMQ